ncbi:Uncharacterized protein FWK35_00026654, partial [Aphis craccivora]
LFIAYYKYPSLDSERSDECIDFTMCVLIFFFFSVITFWGSKNASIFDFSTSFDQKVNLIGTLGGQKKTNQKLREKREFLRKTSFRPNRFIYMVVIQKLITAQFFLLAFEVKKLNIKFSISFASNNYRENLMRHYRKNVLSI